MQRLILFYGLLTLLSVQGAWSGDLKVLYNDRPPLYMVKGETGFIVEIVKLILRDAKIPHKFIEQPANRIIETLQSGKEYAMGIGWFKNPEREVWAQFSKPIYQDRPAVIVVAKSKLAVLGTDPTLGTLLKLPLRLGRKSGYSFGTAADEAIALAKPRVVETTVEIPQLLRMINGGRMDYTLIGPEEVHYILNGDPTLSNLAVVPLGNHPPGNHRHLMLSRTVPPSVVEALNRSIDRVLASPEYKKLTKF